MNKIAALVAGVVFLLLSGIAYSAEKTIVIDDAGRSVEIPLKPERIVVLNPSNLELLYAVGGKAVGRPDSRGIPLELYEKVKGLPSVGQTPNPNVEKIVSLCPDLLIGINVAFHHAIIPAIDRAGIPFLLLSINSYQDILDKLRFYGALTGNKDRASEIIARIEKRVADIKERVSIHESKRVAIIWGSPESFNMALPSSFVGNLIDMLGGINIASGTKPLLGMPQFAPLSMEYLLAKDPDVIFVITHGNDEKVSKKLIRELEGHPAWKGLRAVREKRLHLLPFELFGVNPATRVADAIEHIARLMYPEIFAERKGRDIHGTLP